MNPHGSIHESRNKNGSSISGANSPPLQMINCLRALILWLCFSSCSTSSTFKLPEGSTIEISNRGIRYDSDKRVSMEPFFWSAAGGIPYKIWKNEQVVDEGKLASEFRVLSIFWPPFSIIYWPMNFQNSQYDLTQTAKTEKATIKKQVEPTGAPDDKQNTFQKAKKCQDKGGVWVDSECILEIK